MEWTSGHAKTQRRKGRKPKASYKSSDRMRTQIGSCERPMLCNPESSRDCAKNRRADHRSSCSDGISSAANHSNMAIFFASLRLCVRRRIGQNGCDDRVRAGDSTQVRTPDRALRVHRFVRILGCVTIDVKHLCQDFSSPVKKVRHIHQAEYINQQKVTMLIRFQTNAISLELNRLPKGPFWRREISKSSQSTRGNPTIGQNHSACQTNWRKPTDLRGRKLEFEPGGLYGFSKSMSSTPKLANATIHRCRGK
jgi:hypothetical protein